MYGKNSYIPPYKNLFLSGELSGRKHAASALLSSCTLCPRRCHVDRSKGQSGFCKAGLRASVSHFLAHHGEEPPISGMGGAGTIFFSHCNLACIFCQNYQISQLHIGREVSKEELAGMMLKLQEDGCHNVEFVSPTSHLPAILMSLEIAIERGLNVPIVYNTNGYETTEALALLDGIVDIYMPDFKYADDDLAREFSGVEEYSRHALLAIKEMQRQVGNLRGTGDIAFRGLIIRHLILPRHMENTYKVLSMIASELSNDVHLSLMSQYAPAHNACNHAVIGRRLEREEYDLCVGWIEQMGFENAWLQEIESADDLIPDFTRPNPFPSKRG